MHLILGIPAAQDSVSLRGARRVMRRGKLPSDGGGGDAQFMALRGLGAVQRKTQLVAGDGASECQRAARCSRLCGKGQIASQELAGSLSSLCPGPAAMASSSSVRSPMLVHSGCPRLFIAG